MFFMSHFITLLLFYIFTINSAQPIDKVYDEICSVAQSNLKPILELQSLPAVAAAPEVAQIEPESSSPFADVPPPRVYDLVKRPAPKKVNKKEQTTKEPLKFTILTPFRHHEELQQADENAKEDDKTYLEKVMERSALPPTDAPKGYFTQRDVRNSVKLHYFSSLFLYFFEYSKKIKKKRRKIMKKKSYFSESSEKEKKNYDKK